MRKQAKTLLFATAFVAGIAAATSLYADDPGNTGGGGGTMMSPGMMGGAGITPMKNEQMSDMMDHCSQMMQGADDGGSGVPNEQWKKKAPVTPEKDG